MRMLVPLCLILALTGRGVLAVRPGEGSEGGDVSTAVPISEPQDDGGDSRLVEHNGVSVEKHRWSQHTEDHDPCERHRCAPGEACRVVKNPVLQFPVAVCESSKSTGKDVSQPAAVQCEAQHMGGNPFDCHSEAGWRAMVKGKCSADDVLSGFEVRQRCLTFSGDDEYMFATFKCCKKAPASGTPKADPPKSPAKPKPKAPTKPKHQPQPPPKPKSHPPPPSKQPAKPERKAPAKPAPKLKPAEKKQKPTLKPTPKSEPEKKTVAAPVKKLPTSKQSVVTSPPKPQPAKTQEQVEAKTEKTQPIVTEQAPTSQKSKEKVEEEPKEVQKNAGGDGSNKEEDQTQVRDSAFASGMWSGIGLAVAVVIAIIVIMVVVVRLRYKQVFPYKSQPHSRLHNEDDDTDKLDFDDTELSFFVNQAATNEEECIEEEASDHLPSHLEHWDMDAMNFAKTVPNTQAEDD